MADYEQQPSTAIYSDINDWLKELEEIRNKCANSMQGGLSGRMRARITQAKHVVMVLASRDNIAYARTNE